MLTQGLSDPAVPAPLPPTGGQALALLPSADFKPGGDLTLVSVSSSFPGFVFVGAWTHGGKPDWGGRGSERSQRGVHA